MDAHGNSRRAVTAHGPLQCGGELVEKSTLYVASRFHNASVQPPVECRECSKQPLAISLGATRLYELPDKVASQSTYDILVHVNKLTLLEGCPTVLFFSYCCLLALQTPEMVVMLGKKRGRWAASGTPWDHLAMTSVLVARCDFEMLRNVFKNTTLLHDIKKKKMN